MRSDKGEAIGQSAYSVLQLLDLACRSINDVPVLTVKGEVRVTSVRQHLRTTDTSKLRHVGMGIIKVGYAMNAEALQGKVKDRQSLRQLTDDAAVHE